MSVMRASELPGTWADSDRVFTVEDLEDKDKPSLTVLELHRGKYTEAARVGGDEAFEAVRPFPVMIVPADLVTTGSR